MRKVALLSLLALTFLPFSAGAFENARLAYEKAKAFEEKEDIQNALLWYKKSAKLGLEEKQQKEPSTVQQKMLYDETKRVKNIEKNYISTLSKYDNNETQSSVEQILSSSFDIQPYKMNYLLPFTYNDTRHENRKNSETKFQVSFKKNLLQNFFGLNESLFVAYTQTSWWQTSAQSTPFRETNYAPEIFMLFPYGEKESPLKAYKIGLLHESNGQDEEKSRSWNRIYAQGFFQLGEFLVSPRFWYRLPERDKINLADKNGDDNPDIYKYLGYGDISISYPWGSHFFTLLVKNNFDFVDKNRGAVQLDWTFPLFGKDMFGFIQLYSGYGESLIDYNKRNDKIGIGFAISR
ncbi:MAG: phospholipase A [Sulfurospirillaceae bacterium]|nr:phospholipase A [Sulfurospirillaceae bacterium]